MACARIMSRRPHAQRNLTEPYDFIYDHDDTPLARELYRCAAVISTARERRRSWACSLRRRHTARAIAVSRVARRHRPPCSSYAPIVSFFVGKDFADVPFVTTDDWETATGERVFWRSSMAFQGGIPLHA